MQIIYLRQCLRTSVPTLHSPDFRSICVSFSRSITSDLGSKYIPNHPILSLLEVAYNKSIDPKTLHAYTITSGLIRDTFAASRIVEFCLKSDSGDRQYAHVVFESVDRPDVYTWNAMILAHTKNDSPHPAIGYYFQMLARRIPPNNYTFALVVKACMVGSSENWLGRKMHGQILKHGVEDLLVVRNSLMTMYCNMGCLREARILFDSSLNLDFISWNSMISGYGKHGDVQSARDLFERMPNRSLVSWSAMIDGYVRSGGFIQALELFNEMQVLGIKPDTITLATVLKACANLGALDQGRWVHKYVEKNNLERDMNVVLATALVDMYAKCGCLDVALQVFNVAHEKDVILWNSMIGGLAMHGHGQDALELFSRMKSYGLMPNGTTFIGLLCACTHTGMVKEGLEIFDSMKKDYGIEPCSEHYGCVADLLGRAGLVQEAEKVIINMPMEPQASQWGTLMSACRTHNNVEVGERVGKHLISLEPHDGGRYVLLSNIYAAAGRWEDARETRRVMEEKGIKKERGCSFLEWNGVVHEFFVGDTSHVQSKEIYSLLGEIERQLKMVGYIQDTSQMLMNMADEEEKEIALSYHSEKLAIAFGIINVSQGTPIRIAKNLRVCGDCHTYTKLVSKIYQREIIVRDRHRFHRFTEGLCSCLDYW